MIRRATGRCLLLGIILAVVVPVVPNIKELPAAYFVPDPAYAFGPVKTVDVAPEDQKIEVIVTADDDEICTYPTEIPWIDFPRVDSWDIGSNREVIAYVENGDGALHSITTNCITVN